MTYTLASARNSPDLYLSGRHTRGREKFSFHQSGSWSHSIPDEFSDRVVRDFDSRHLDIWRAPPEFASGWTRAFYIAVPRTELRAENQKFLKGNVRLAPDPGRGAWAVINILFARNASTKLLVRDYYILGRLDLSDGTTVVVVANRSVPSATTSRVLADERNQMIEEIWTNEEMRDRLASPDTDFYVSLHGPSADGTNGLVEISLTPIPWDLMQICSHALRIGIPDFEEGED